MVLTIIIMIIGFLLLVLGADMLVKGSSNIAKRFHIPEMLIGLTIVAIRNIYARISYNNIICWKRCNRFNNRKCNRQ